MKLSKKFFSAVFLCTVSACMHNNGTQSQMKTENDSTVTPNLKCYADSNKIELYVKHNGDTKKYGVDLYTNDTNLSDAKYAYNTNNEHSEGRVLNLMTGKEKEVDPAFNGLEAEITNYEKIESGEANDPDNSGITVTLLAEQHTI
ncbi:MAG: hypothetical protein R3B45_18065 [Bdellovibrionota bacterium]